MKFIVVCACLVVLAVSSTATPSGDGRPGCRTETEITNRVYRNFWDSTAYWVCSELNVAASAARCPDEEGFLASQNKCVSWDDWIWEPLVAPLSVPAPATAAPAKTTPATAAPAEAAPAEAAP